LNSRYTETIVDRDLLSPFHRYLTDIVDVRGFAYSVGGDEFVILLRNVDASEALAFASRLLRMTTERSFIVEGETRTITLSVGVAAYPSDVSSLSGLRELANRAERKAKEEGRARVCSAATLTNAALLDSPMQPA
jgi:diguanylate cyclase (GGDEF)-like protein